LATKIGLSRPEYRDGSTFYSLVKGRMFAERKFSLQTPSKQSVRGTAEYADSAKQYCAVGSKVSSGSSRAPFNLLLLMSIFK
jgi:hypothetical protein